MASGLVFSSGKPHVLLIESDPKLGKPLPWALSKITVTAVGMGEDADKSHYTNESSKSFLSLDLHWALRESNPRPTRCKHAALPLS